MVASSPDLPQPRLKGVSGRKGRRGDPNVHRSAAPKLHLAASASSLTELFAPGIHEERIAGLLANYSLFTDEVMAYFRKRLHQAPRDAGFALQFVRERAGTPEERNAVCQALTFKTDVLWVQLDALQHAYVEGHVPPGVFIPDGG